MTDKELLELAAKAAGFNDATWAAEQASIATLEQKRGFKLFWNPLKDDGDALRLAVKCNLNVCIGYASVSACLQDDGSFHQAVEIKDDSYAATRRAIVRAVAEIGRNME